MTNWLSGKRVIITGGDGFVGRHVVAIAAAAGADVTTLSLFRQAQTDIRHITLDLRDGNATDSGAIFADAMIHLAARSGGIQVQDREDLLRDNIRITANALDLASSAGVERLFIASSASVYPGSEHALWFDESSPTIEPSSPSANTYAWSKLTNEFQVHSWAAAHGGDVVVGRLANVFGPGGSFDPIRSTVIHSIIKRAVETEPGQAIEVWGDGSQQRTFAYIEDAAGAIVHLMSLQHPPSIVNISTTPAASITEVADIVANRTAHHPADLRYLPDMPQGPGSRLVANQLLSESGFRPQMNLESGIARTIEAYLDLTEEDPVR